MPIRVPHHQVVIHREGKNIRVPIGKPFDFTQGEIEEIHRLNPQSLRRAVVEAPAEVTSVEMVDDDGNPDTPPVSRRTAAQKRAATQKRPADATDEDDEL